MPGRIIRAIKSGAAWSPANAWITLTCMAVGSAIIGVLVWWFFIHPAQVRQHNNEVRVNSAIQGGRTESAVEATNAVANQASADATTDEQTRQGNETIHRTPGASAPVSRELNDAGRRALCMRDLYRNTPDCRKLLGSRP